jgi:hypothetical protein
MRIGGAVRFIRTAVDDIEVDDMKTCKDCEHHLAENDCAKSLPVAYHIKAESCKEFDPKPFKFSMTKLKIGGNEIDPVSVEKMTI